MKKIAKLLITPLLGLVLSFAPVGLVSATHEPGHTENTNAEAICEGVGLIDGQDSCSAGDPQQGVEDIIKTAINIISIFVGVAAVVMIIIGGFKYITSSGDSNNINSAKNTILYAIVGLVFVALSQVIVRFVLEETAGG